MEWKLASAVKKYLIEETRKGREEIGLQNASIMLNSKKMVQESF